MPSKLPSKDFDPSRSGVIPAKPVKQVNKTEHLSPRQEKRQANQQESRLQTHSAYLNSKPEVEEVEQVIDLEEPTRNDNEKYEFLSEVRVIPLLF